MSDPFLKWAGGKRWLVAQRPEWLRPEASRHVEPFLGSGAVFFRAEPTKAILSDLNAELIETYVALREHPVDVWRNLQEHQRQHSAEYYYRIRAMVCRTPVTRAARFIYLNRTCFNGLYRVNLRGEFNVPKGTKNAVLLPNDDFASVSMVLRRAKLCACDFSTTISVAGEGDFLYVDPPYTVRHNANNFLKYNEQIFSWHDQQRLAKDLALAAKRGASILMSNADHSCIHRLYAESVWQQIPVHRFSKLASSAEHRKATTELVVSNYLTENGKQEDPRY
jgi:DNA adenine methylase